MGGLRVVRSECTRKSGAAHRCHHSGQSRQGHEKADARAGKEIQGRWLAVFEGTPEEQAILTNMARKDAKIPVMVTFDGEWGLSMRLKGAPDYPRNAALGCIEDNGLIEEYGREVARQFRELGYTSILHPMRMSIRIR